MEKAFWQTVSKTIYDRSKAQYDKYLGDHENFEVDIRFKYRRSKWSSVSNSSNSGSSSASCCLLLSLKHIPLVYYEMGVRHTIVVILFMTCFLPCMTFMEELTLSAMELPYCIEHQALFLITSVAIVNFDGNYPSFVYL